MTNSFIYHCPTEEDTINLAKAISSIAKAGDVFALYGTLGMGKSVFARAFIQNLTDVDDVPSPTFTLAQSYEAPQFEIYHFDLYRLKSPEEVWELNIEEAMSFGVCLIEWPEKMGAYLPRDIFKINISNDDHGGRKIVIETSSQDKIKRLSADKRVHHE